MAAQSSDEVKTAAADIVLPNDGTREDLEGRVAALWEDLTRDGRGSSGYTGSPKRETTGTDPEERR
jgi:dephospho-CoA kinase